MNVLSFSKIFAEINYDKSGEALEDESLLICCLFHDLCKVNVRKMSEKWIKNESTKDRWWIYNGWEYDDKFPLGHGEKSLYMIHHYIPLKAAEALAIRWHMGPWENSAVDGTYGRFNFPAAMKVSLVRVVMMSDTATLLIEDTVDMKANAHPK